MRAVTQQRYGGTEALAVSDVPTPTPGPDEVLLRVRAAGVDRGTWHLMTGEPYLMRLALGFRGPRQSVLGRDVAGVVEAVGADVTSFAVGDEVMGTADGSFAEHAVVPVRRLAHKPATISFEEAAVLPISGGTALQAVRDAGRLRPSQRVLVLGASGGVGSYAVQVAVAGIDDDRPDVIDDGHTTVDLRLDVVVEGIVEWGPRICHRAKLREAICAADRLRVEDAVGPAEGRALDHLATQA